jgi:CRP/FNR family transcriptional regulator, cyclic AMP receptor protein
MQPFTKTLKAGAHLFHEKDHSRELYIIQDGSVLIYRTMAQREVVLARLDKGAVLGEMALIDGKPRSASARVVADCRLIMIDAETFHDKIRGVPPWYLSIIRTTSEKIRKANQRLQSVNAEYQDARLVIAFSHFFARYCEETDGQKSLDMAALKKQFLQLMCVTHQRLVWIMEFLEKNGFAMLRDNRIFIVNMPAFGEYVEFLRGLVRKTYDKVPAAAELLEKFVTACGADKRVATGEKEARIDLAGDEFWTIVKCASLAESWQETVRALKETGLLMVRKSGEPVTQENPCSGSSYSIDCTALRKWRLYFAYSTKVPVS